MNVNESAENIVWKNLPNTISLCRILASPALLGLVIASQQESFTWLLLACLLSDILDGLIARLFDLRSELGVILDSTGDILVSIVATIGVFCFQQEFIERHYHLLLGMIGLYLAEVLFAFWRYGRISSFHTILDRVAASFQGIFVISLFLFGYQGWLFYMMVATSMLAYAEELVLLCLLPEWTSNVLGLYWVISRKRANGR